MNDKRNYDWIILFLFGISAFIRYFMWKNNFLYTDYFIGLVNLVCLDYVATTIIYNINSNINSKIKELDIIELDITNKIRKHKNSLHICIFILIIYNIIHFIFLSNSVSNDILSMLVLGVSLTDNSITLYLSEKIKI